MSTNKVVLLLGSNLGEKEKNISTALKHLQQGGCDVIKKTTIKETKPVEFGSINNFCNIAVLINTNLSPVRLLKFLKSIELKMGRTADSKVRGQYEDRIIDIDIVFFNNLEFISNQLEIPHKKNAYERDFAVNLLFELENPIN